MKEERKEEGRKGERKQREGEIEREGGGGRKKKERERNTVKYCVSSTNTEYLELLSPLYYLC